MLFSFLHSAQSNVTLFADALEGSDLEPLHHIVRNDLLTKVTQRGGIDVVLAQEIEAAILGSLEGADLLLLTCSSLSPVADILKGQGIAVERTDRLLAETVFAKVQEKLGASVTVLIAAQTTRDPTRALFEAVRDEVGASDVPLKVVVLPNVWDLFLSGDLDGYQRSLTKAIDAFLEGQIEGENNLVALGQASMGPALLGCSSAKAAQVFTVAGATREFLTNSAK